MKISKIWDNEWMRRWGKYILTILIFGVVYFFVGDQSVIRFIQRGSEIKHLEEQCQMYNTATEKAMREIQSLDHPDSLERFAREQYYMHTTNEDVYLVDE